MNAAIVRDVVAVIAPRRGVERQQPDGVASQVADVFEAIVEPDKVADPVGIRVEEPANAVQLIDNGIFVPAVVVA